VDFHSALRLAKASQSGRESNNQFAQGFLSNVLWIPAYDLSIPIPIPTPWCKYGRM
jgi:hypothetical protein